MHDGKKVEGSVSSWTPILTENGRVRTPTGSPPLDLSIVYNGITRKLLKVVHAARGLASIELSFHSWNILRDSRRGVSRRNKMWAAVRENGDYFALAVRNSNNWETVEHRWVDAARSLASTELTSFIQRFA